MKPVITEHQRQPIPPIQILTQFNNAFAPFIKIANGASFVSKIIMADGTEHELVNVKSSIPHCAQCADDYAEETITQHKCVMSDALVFYILQSCAAEVVTTQGSFPVQVIGELGEQITALRDGVENDASND